jgi:formylglycine-generating enzyme required for sulfatase activity
VRGADWAHPEGPRSSLAGREHHPVVHVSRDDALAYCACPVDAFPANGFGLHNVAGNVWEWSADAFSPGGPWAMRGGSFLCHASYCERYQVAARTANRGDTSSSRLGFRCAG